MRDIDTGLGCKGDVTQSRTCARALEQIFLADVTEMLCTSVHTCLTDFRHIELTQVLNSVIPAQHISSCILAVDNFMNNTFIPVSFYIYDIFQNLLKYLLISGHRQSKL